MSPCHFFVINFNNGFKLGIRRATYALGLTLSDVHISYVYHLCDDIWWLVVYSKN